MTLHHSDKCFTKLRSLYTVSDYKRCWTDEFLAGVLKQVAMWQIWCLGEACSRQKLGKSSADLEPVSGVRTPDSGSRWFPKFNGNYSQSKAVIKIHSVFPAIWAKLWKNVHLTTLKNPLKNFPDPDPEVANSQIWISSSLSIDISLVKLTHRYDQ